MGRIDHAGNIVLHLMYNKLNNGHSLYMDNFYNSFDLATKLIQWDTYCTFVPTGSLRSERKNTPIIEVEQAKLNWKMTKPIPDIRKVWWSEIRGIKERLPIYQQNLKIIW